ncbi:MAG TPA: DUF2273 domain-containing protein [Candidatus Agathobaculum pullicola]|nr:DUF2273 domain-containing protein [Candidatus Agathobaculum pullicola]
MSENHKPLTAEQTESVQTVAQPSETDQAALSTATDSEAMIERPDDVTEEALAEAADIDPADVRIFGMPRVGFHCTALGVAGGYLISGLVGIAGFHPPDANICAIVCASIGYFIGNRLYKNRKTGRDAAGQRPESTE